MESIKRGEIYFADLNISTGSEQGGQRPVIVIQNDKGNHYSPTVIVAVITSKNKKYLPTHININTGEGNILMDSTIMLEQIRTIDKNRLQRYIGSVSKDKMEEINKAMLISLGLAS